MADTHKNKPVVLQVIIKLPDSILMFLDSMLDLFGNCNPIKLTLYDELERKELQRRKTFNPHLYHSINPL